MSKRIPACAVYWLTLRREHVTLPNGGSMFLSSGVWYGVYTVQQDGAPVRVTRSLGTNNAAQAAFNLGRLLQEAK